MQDPFADIPTIDASQDVDPFADIPTIEDKKKQDIQDMLMDYMKQSASTLGNAGLSGATSIINFPTSTINALEDIGGVDPKYRLDLLKGPTGPGSGLGNAMGDIATFVGGGEALDASRGAAEAIPYLGKIFEALGRGGGSATARRALGSAGYGAVQSPDDRTFGALEGGALSAGSEALPAALSGINPKKYMSTVYQTIADQLGKVKGESSAMYKSIMNKFGDQPVEVSGLNDEVFNTQSGLKKLYGEFTDNPTLENAHRLQSQLGSSERSLVGKDVSTWDRKNDYKDARQTLLSGIYDSLGKNSPEAQSAYSSAAEHYRDRVLPFQMTSDSLQKMVNPTPESMGNKLEAITKKDLYPSTRIGEMRIPNVPPEISKLQKSLASKTKARNIAQTLGGATLGGTALHSIGIPIGAEMMGGMALSGAAPYALRKSIGKGGSSSFMQALSDALSKLYKGGSKATIATLLGGQ